MNHNRKLIIFVVCLLTFSLVVAHASNKRTQLTETRSVELPSYAILDERAGPAIASTGKVGFISSVTGGSVMSFNMKTGRIISSVSVGETVGPASLVEIGKKRFITVAAANNPGQGHPATVSVIDATSAQGLDLHALLVLPLDAQITPATQALLTRDGRFSVIASSFDVPALFALNVETGEVASRFLLSGRPSDVALYDGGAQKVIAVASAAANIISIFKLDAQGQLSSLASFSPDGAQLEESNNVAFSADGRRLYFASAASDKLYALDTESGAQIGSASVASPHHVTVKSDPAGGDLIGVVRLGRQEKAGGVTILTNREGRLEVRSEFTPPDEVKFSRANNVVFDASAETAFVGSATGVLFAFSPETAELQSYQVIGGELRRIELNEKGRNVAAVRSSLSGDVVVIVNFDLVGAEDEDAQAPRITSLSPDTVEQGRLKNLRLVVMGENFTDGSSLLVNGAEVAADLARKGAALEARLPKSLFDQPTSITIQVKRGDGVVSQPAVLRVVRPSDPTITKIRPNEVPGPSQAFTLKVKGENFRPSSIIYVGDQPLNTQLSNPTELRAQVPQELASNVREYTVQVKDRAVPDAISNEARLTIFGPRVTEVKPGKDTIIAGAGNFGLKIRGDNFRDGAKVEINGEALDSSRTRRLTGDYIRVSVPGRLAEDAGTLSVVVRNPEGNASEAKQVEALAPVVSDFDPKQLLAGVDGARVNIVGNHFRRGARVYVGNTGDPDRKAFRVPRRSVRFRSSQKIVVSLEGELGQLLAQPGTLKFQVVNPNKGDGVPSTDGTLQVAGPSIAAVTINETGDEARVRMVITGANFRTGAVIELVKDGETFARERTPARIRDDRITVNLKARLLRLGTFQVRVVNPGNVRSEPRPVPESLIGQQ